MLIDKKEAANRQLDEAIRLFFEGRDAVAIHSLVGAASLLFSQLIDTKAPNESWDKKAQITNNLSRKEYFAQFRRTQNFLKHADKDPDESIDFDPIETTHIAFFATLNNAELGDILSEEQSFFQIWYLAVNPEYIPSSNIEIKKVISVFGDIASLSFEEKVAVGSKLWRSKIAS